MSRMLANNNGQGAGSIINMSSMCSRLKGLPSRFVYDTTKAAVIGLIKGVAADFVGMSFRCNAIASGTVDTPSLHDRINTNADPIAARKAFVARKPTKLRRWWFFWLVTSQRLSAARPTALTAVSRSDAVG